MCGIAGMLSRRGGADETTVRRMARALAHRGPDDLGLHVAGPLGLAHTRLSIIDLQHGHQPMVDDGLALVANGEIYNFVERRRALEARGRRFRTRSDSETILHAYALDGLEALASLDGMFAFAIHDAGKAELVLVRDRLGVKPLYYALLPDRLLFASELKALLAVWPRQPELDPAALVQYLQNRFNTAETCLVRGIHRVPPGTALVIDAELRIREHRYWSPLHVRERPRTLDEATGEFEGLFRQVLREHLRSDVPYGLFLSSGIDSGSVLAMITEIGGQPVRTFSAGYGDVRAGDELAHAAGLAQRYGAKHTEVVLDGRTALRRLPHTVWATDDLLHDFASLPTSFLAEAAAAEVKVVLTGEGGDEVFAGYGRYRRHPVQRWLKSLVAPGSGGFRTRAYWLDRWARQAFGPELQAASAARRAPFIAAWQETPPSWDHLSRCQHVDLTTYLPDDLLVKLDRVLMAFGVEGRVPFLDHRVVEFGLSLPRSLKVGGRHGKLMLRRWAEDRLSRDYAWRRKRGFFVPIRQWLRGDVVERLATLLPRNPAIRRWFRPGGVAALVREQQMHGSASRALWGLMQLAIWHRIFVEGHVPGRDEDPLNWIA
jgi:asparagine synthase (glutamine-hydrolysing)